MPVIVTPLTLDQLAAGIAVTAGTAAVLSRHSTDASGVPQSVPNKPSGPGPAGTAGLPTTPG
jgi:hypothetical protein